MIPPQPPQARASRPDLQLVRPLKFDAQGNLDVQAELVGLHQETSAIRRQLRKLKASEVGAFGTLGLLMKDLSEAMQHPSAPGQLSNIIGLAIVISVMAYLHRRGGA